MLKRQLLLRGHHKVVLNDCLQEFARGVPKADMLLTDLPYAVTQAKWDNSVLDPNLWRQFCEYVRPDGALVFTANMNFAFNLLKSSQYIVAFRYDIVWEKSKATGYLNAKKQPMRAHENILVFSQKPHRYFPVMSEGAAYDKGKAHRPTEVYGEQRAVHVKSTGKRYPRSVVYFKTAESEGPVLHPTQKPVALFEYLIRLYTKPGDLVLDCCAGVGTTGVAAKRTGRKSYSIEINPKYAKIAARRIRGA